MSKFSARTFRAALSSLAAAMISVFVILVLSANADASATKFHIRAGDGEQGFAVNEFLPESITIRTGDTVRWVFPWMEPHTVSFNYQGPPDPANVTSPVIWDGVSPINSGLIFGSPSAPPSFEVTFTQPGTYQYFCVIHPFMTGTVTVVDSGPVDTQDDLDARGEAEYAAAIGPLKALAAQRAAQDVQIQEKGDGTKKYTFLVGGETENGDVQQFFPAVARIEMGDTVEWVNEGFTPHTVTFGAPPAGLPPDPFAWGRIAPSDTFDGTGFWNSGIIGQPYPDGTSFSMTFSTEGTFNYYCVLHESQGMRGTVIVGARTSPPSPPTATPHPPATGTGISGSGGTFGNWLLLAAGAAAVAGGVLLVAARRR